MERDGVRGGERWGVDRVRGGGIKSRYYIYIFFIGI